MLTRVFALCVLSVASGAAVLQAQDLFVLPGSGSPSGVVQAFVTNPLTTYNTFSAPVGTFALLPNLSASQYFAVGSTTENSIYSIEATSLAPTVIASLPILPTQALITPNGKFLVVVAGVVHLYNTATNAELISGGISQGTGINTFAVAASLDSTTLFALGSAAGGTSQLNAISTTTGTVTATLPFTELATAVGVAPNGLVYVSLPDEIVEINPLTLQPTFNGTISVSGTPGPLTFTPDGLYALGTNQSTVGNSLLIATLASHTATDPSLGLPQLTSLQLTGVDTVLALSNQGLYQITISPLSVVPINIANIAQSGVLALTTTNDVPSLSHSTVQAVYLVSSNTIYQYNPATQAIVPSPQPLAPNVVPNAISYAVAADTAAKSNPASLLTYGSNQTILPSATSAPLVVRVLDANNLPLSGYDVGFQITGSGAALYSTSAITGSNGYALTYVTASSTPGSVTVTATVGTLTTSFSVIVSTTAQTGGGPTLTIVSGQGQLMVFDTSTQLGPLYGSSLQVLATDVNGNPIVGLPVTFSVPPQGGTIQVSGQEGADSQVVNTNSAGVASVDFETTSSPNAPQGYLQSLVTASAASTNSVTFYITAVPQSPTPNIYFEAPAPGSTVTGAEGSIVPAAIKAQVISAGGIGIPNVALSINDSNVNPALFPSISCNAPGGFVLTNSTGTVACDALFGPRVGTGTFVSTIGYTHTSVPSQFVVTPGPAGVVQITQGNNQTGIPGQTLPLALVVHVTDSGGNTIIGAPVTWQVLTAGAVTLTDVVSVTDSNGNASALATLGSVGGVAQVKATAGTASATFSITVNIPSTGIQKVSGDQQTAVINTAFTSPLTVEVVDSSNTGVAGAQVNFQVASGTATLGSTLVITNSSGQASTTVTAGTTPGAITVTAISGAFSVSFNLTARLAGPSNIVIVNGASFDPNTGISPGSIATITGVGILSGVTGVLPAPTTGGLLPTTFSGVTISFNGTPAPIFYVESNNGTDTVTVQVPFEVQPGSAVSLDVSVANSGSATVPITVKPLAPGVFTTVYAGKAYASAVRPDGSYVSPTNPAQRGENIQIYVTGLGQATPSITTGNLGVADQVVAAPLILGLNNGGVRQISAVYGPGLIGVYVVTLQVPADTPTGTYQPVGVVAYDSAGNAYFAQPTYIPIQ
jgi:uncharacterized protein (TIGR03437 family)